MTRPADETAYEAWRKDIQSRYPRLYENVVCGFYPSEGWKKIIETLSEQLEEFPNIRCAQVKEKFGTLRFYYSFVDAHTAEEREKVKAIVETAEFASSKTCETCGEQGVSRVGGWIATLCDAHSEGREPEEFDGDPPPRVSITI